MESYGTDLVISFIEMSGDGKRDQKAKIAFWDTTSANVNKLIWVEFPDQMITALKNADGVLYAFSGNVNARGFRVSQYIGGYSFKEIYYSETGEPPLPGAVDAILNRVLMGSHTTVPESDGCVYSVGLQNSRLGSGIFNVMRSTGGNSSTSISSVLVADNTELGFYVPIIGWTQAGEGSSGVSHGLDKQGTQYNNAPSVLWSSTFRIGQPFKITKIRIPLAQAVAASMILIPKIYTDDGAGTTYTLTTINNTNYPNSERNITYRLQNTTGQHNFWLELRWTGSALLTCNLPIIISGELIDD